MENLESRRALLQFLNDSPSCYHAADQVVRALTEAGYTPQLISVLM